MDGNPPMREVRDGEPAAPDDRTGHSGDGEMDGGGPRQEYRSGPTIRGNMLNSQY